MTSPALRAPAGAWRPGVAPVAPGAMDTETMTMPGREEVRSTEASPAGSDGHPERKSLLQQMTESRHLREAIELSQDVMKNETLVHSLAVGATLVGFACLVGFVRFGMEAVYATIASSMLTTLAGWLVFFLTGLLIKFIEKFTTKSSTSSTERSSTAVLLLIYCAAGCLPGVLQQPMSRVYLMSTLLTIACATSLTFLIMIRDLLCHIMPCEQHMGQL